MRWFAVCRRQLVRKFKWRCWGAAEGIARIKVAHKRHISVMSPSEVGGCDDSSSVASQCNNCRKIPDENSPEFIQVVSDSAITMIRMIKFYTADQIVEVTVLYWVAMQRGFTTGKKTLKEAGAVCKC